MYNHPRDSCPFISGIPSTIIPGVSCPSIPGVLSPFIPGVLFLFIPGVLPRSTSEWFDISSTDERIRKELSKASFQEAPFGARRLCVEGFGESWALTTLDDYFSMGDEDFAR